MDKTATLVPGRTYVYLAEPGTPAPADATTVMDAAWRNVGYTTVDSLEFSTSPSFTDMTSAQSDYPIRKFQTDDAATVAVVLEEFSGENFRAVYGGGTITEITPPLTPAQYKFVPPRLGEHKEVSAVVEVIDGAHHFRYVFPAAMQTDGVQSQLQKGSGSTLPLSLAVLGGDNADAWYLLTDSSAFTPAP